MSTNQTSPGTPKQPSSELSVGGTLRHELDFAVFWLRIRKLCMEYGGSVTGGPRTDQRNAKVGGVTNSWHLWRRGGLAADLAFDYWEDQVDACDEMRREGYDVLEYDSHVHIEPGDG